jgi:hypothetical protein
MPIIDNFKKDRKIIDDDTLDLKTITKIKKDYYKNIIKYIDEYTYFNFLKLSDPLYGFNFNTMLPYYIKVNVGISIATIIYQRKYPDDEEIDPLKLQIIKQNIENGILN